MMRVFQQSIPATTQPSSARDPMITCTVATNA